MIFQTRDFALAQPERMFTTPVIVSGTGRNPHAATDDDGRVYVTYDNDGNSIEFAKSGDHGVTFSTTAPVETGQGWYPRIAIDNAERAYVIYTFQSGLDYWPRGFRGTPPGYTPFTKIVDETVLAPNQGAGSESQCDVSVENVGGTNNIYVVWGDNNTGAGWDIWFAGENDDDDDFTEPVGASISDSTGARYPVLAVEKSEQNHVYVAWVNTTTNALMFDYSTDGGANFQPAGNIQISDAGASVEHQRPGLAASSNAGAQVFAIWTDNKDIYVDYSTDWGATWLSPPNGDINIGSAAGAGAEQDQPSIAVTPGTTHLYAVWRDNRNGAYQIFFQEAMWQGSTFVWGIDKNADDKIEDTADWTEVGEDMRVSDAASGHEQNPTVVAGSNGVYVVWHDDGASIKCARYLPDAFGVPIEAPENLTAVGGNTIVTLNWDDNTEADLDHYNIYRSATRGSAGSVIGTSPAGTSAYTDDTPPLTNGTCYWYVVTAVNDGADESEDSNDACATPNAIDTTVPGAPTNLQADPGNQMVGLTWNASAAGDLVKYRVYRSAVSGGPFTFLGEVTAPDVWYFDNGLTNGTPYWYVVTAVDLSNNQSLDSNSAWAIPGTSSAGMGTAPGGVPPGNAPEGGGPGGGCFIATACYGSPFAGEVRVLSGFRDRYLLSNNLGRTFVRGYYRLSPPVAGFIAEKPLLKFLVRIQLKPWIKIANAVVDN
jgi:hypothetical protein